MSRRYFSASDLYQLVDSCFELIHEETHRHHQMVAYLSYRLCLAADLDENLRSLIVQAAYLHDIGGAINENNVTLNDIEAAGYHAAQLSADLLEDFEDFASLGMIIRHCQDPYHKNKKLRFPQSLTKIPFMKFGRLNSLLFAADLIHLADTVSLLIDTDKSVLNQIPLILEGARKQEDQDFSKESLDALDKLKDDEGVWFDLAYAPDMILEDLVKEQETDLEGAKMTASLISMVIDFRSPFTAMHSAGVAASAKALAHFAGFSDEECELMEIAGKLHDIGKIRTPKEILEKPGKLSTEEFNIIKEHAYFTDMLLSKVHGFEEIGKWASLHHEKLNGAGYPYHLKDQEIPLGAKIMAVADVFSAIREDRPYRKGMDDEKVRSILNENAEKGELSKLVVDLLIDNYDAINAERDKASKLAGRRYYRSINREGNKDE